MSNWISMILSLVMSWWNGLSKEDKQKIIEELVVAAEKTFRYFYRAYQAQKSQQSPADPGYKEGASA